MSGKSIASPFQILDWRILSFSCTNQIMGIPEGVEHHWMIKAHIDHLDPLDDKLQAVVSIEFDFYAEHEGRRIGMKGQSVAFCFMDTANEQDAEQRFQAHLSRTAMTNSLANLRVFLLQAGTLHQMGPKRIMLPFIDLNKFSFDEELTFTT